VVISGLDFSISPEPQVRGPGLGVLDYPTGIERQGLPLQVKTG
jgi:hypothetical protein